jgi:hypothetical protein
MVEDCIPAVLYGESQVVVEAEEQEERSMVWLVAVLVGLGHLIVLGIVGYFSYRCVKKQRVNPE